MTPNIFGNSYGITHNPGGLRRPLSSGLKAGQFRMNGIQMFPSRTTIINNYGGSNMWDCHYADDCFGGYGGYQKPSFFEKLMVGIGLGGGLLGTLAGIFGGKTEKVSGSEGDEDNAKNNAADLAALRELYGSNYSIAILSDGTWHATSKKDPNVYVTADSAKDLMEALNKAKPPVPESPKEVTDGGGAKPEVVVPSVVEKEPEVVDEQPAAELTPSPAPANAAPAARTGGVKVQTEWYKANTANSDMKGDLALDKVKAAEADPARYVAETILGRMAKSDKEAASDELRKLIIQYNPSVFQKDGKLKPDISPADFAKLDIPNADWLKANINTLKAGGGAKATGSTTNQAASEYTAKPEDFSVNTLVGSTTYSWNSSPNYISQLIIGDVGAKFVIGGKSYNLQSHNNSIYMLKYDDLGLTDGSLNSSRILPGDKFVGSGPLNGKEVVWQGDKLGVMISGQFVTLDAIMAGKVQV